MENQVNPMEIKIEKLGVMKIIFISIIFIAINSILLITEATDFNLTGRLFPIAISSLIWKLNV